MFIPVRADAVGCYTPAVGELFCFGAHVEGGYYSLDFRVACVFECFNVSLALSDCPYHCCAFYFYGVECVVRGVGEDVDCTVAGVLFYADEGEVGVDGVEVL